MNALDLRSITAGYDHTPVLRGFDMTIPPGETVTLLGPSGCGKTTVLRVAASFLTPDSGTVYAAGAPVLHPDRNRFMVFQEPMQLLPWKTVIGNVLFSLSAIGVEKATARERAAAMLARLGLAGSQERFPHQLSGGMKQRVALARAFVLNPAVLLLDEPFASVDAPRRRELQDLLLDLVRIERPAVLFVTHDLDEAVRIGGRVLVMSRGGQIVAEETRPERERIGALLEQMHF